MGFITNVSWYEFTTTDGEFATGASYNKNIIVYKC